jgi:hypothetical protein
MPFAQRARRVVAPIAAAALLFLASGGAHAQDASESHLKAARAAISAINATDQYDAIIPQAVQALTQELIQQHPDIRDLIISTVREKALALSARRGDLEKEAAIIYAKAFDESELNAIAEFYNSEPGKKLLARGPSVARELVKAAEIWQRGIARDLAVEVGKHLEQVVNVRPAPPMGTPLPGTEAAPERTDPAPAQ